MVMTANLTLCLLYPQEENPDRIGGRVGCTACVDGLEKSEGEGERGVRERALFRAKNQALDYPAHCLVALLATLSWLPIQLFRAESMRHLQRQSV
jgi:hypothetical protein